jgi:hypothetical protein
MTFIFSGTLALFVVGTLAALWHLRWMHRLPALEAFRRVTGPIRCSVVIAARNEEARIEQTIRRLLAQRDIEAEVILVDDRSTDRTAEIAGQVAKEDSRLRIIRIHMLSDGWLGKCHACHVGAAAATGEWILFTDADCWLKPDVMARAVGLAESEGRDHITLTSGMAVLSPGLRACHLMFLLSISNWFSGVNRDRPESHLGFGAFNLVRACAYRECGGYEALRLTVLDDVKLGLLLRRAGKGTRAFLGGDDVTCYWGANVASMIKIMEKNYFAALEFSLPLALAISAFVTFLIGIVVIGLFSQTAVGLAAALSPLCLILPAAILARRNGWSWTTAVGAPFVLPVFVCALVNSTFVTLRQGGIRWRETFYPIDALRAGGVR